MDYLRLSLDGQSVLGAVHRAADHALLEAVRKSLPADCNVVQDCWSGEVLRLRGTVVDVSSSNATAYWYMYPGLLAVDLVSGELVVCYGQGQLSDGRGPIPMSPIANLVTNLDGFSAWAAESDLRGAVPAVLESTDGISQVGPPTGRGDGQEVAVTLGGASVRAFLLESDAPLTCRMLLHRLPLSGKATNTIFSGPLVRFWDGAGGADGETVLQSHDNQYDLALPDSPVDRTPVGRRMTVSGERTQEVLYPGHLYYLPRRPWRGIRITTTEATKMRGGFLVPFARFVGDWDSFIAEAEQLMECGARPMTITRIP